MLVPFMPPPGLVSDDTTFSSPGRYADASLVRWYENQWQTQGGWESLTTSLLSGVCRTVYQWSDNAAVLNIAFGTHTALQVWVGGSLYTITPVGFVAGAVDGTGSSGYSTGAYGVGTYSTPSTADFFPLTWSLSAYGQNLIANPRGQGIYLWANNTSTPAAALTNSPAKCTYALSLPQRQIMAFGCSQEVDGVFNPLAIRWCDIEGPTVWNTDPSNNAGEYILEGGGRIVAARNAGDFVFVWTDVALYLGQYIGDPGETWRFEKAGAGGLIGPNAAVVVGQTAFWCSPDAQFYSCTVGGQPNIMDCPIRKSFADNISLGQNDKIIATSIAQFREIKWFYPDMRDGLENSREVTISTGGQWCRGKQARTAFVDAGPSVSPIGCTAGGNAYWHELGTSADGGQIAWFVESTDFYLDEDAANFMLRGVFPNFKDQKGAISMTLYMREHPQATERVKGPYILSPNMPKKSFRVSGRIARIRLEGASVPAFARMGKLEFDVESIGGR